MLVFIKTYALMIYLGQSDVFLKMLETDTLERNTGNIQIPESKDASEAFLQFLYNPDVHELEKHSKSVITDLIKLGHRFNVPSLVQPSVTTFLEKMKEGESDLDSELILELYEFAEQANLLHLKDAIVHVVKR